MIDTQQTYRIPAINFLRLEEEIEKLNKRATKIKTEPIVLTVLEIVTETKRNEVIGFDYEETYHICTFTGSSPKLAGWTLVAVIDPVSEENMVREVPGQTCPVKYRTTDMHCDYCETVRRRNAIFVLRHDNGEHKQVGRNCLADFLGHVHPETLLLKAEYLFSFDKLFRESESDGWGCGGKSPILVPTTEFAAVTAVVIRRLGWLSKSKSSDYEQPTADIVWDVCTRSDTSHVRELIEKNDIHAEKRDVLQSEAAIEWAAALDPVNEVNTYLHDLGVCCRQNYVDYRRRGFVASVISAHQRVLNELEERKVQIQNSKYLGKIKVRQMFNDVLVLTVAPYMSGIYDKTLVRFSDPDGNIIVWRASGSPEWVQLGQKFTVKATVKSHSEYNGVKQTEVSRAEPIGLDVEDT
jgi:ribosomal protein L36